MKIWLRKMRISKRHLQCKTSRISKFPVLLDMRALGTLIVAIVAIFSLASSVQPAGSAKVDIAGPAQGPAIEALFGLDAPAAGPFPSDWFTVPDHANNTHRRISLPLPNCQIYISDCEDIAALNELDGFNVQPRLSVPFSGPIDPNTVTSDTIFLVSLGSTGPGQDYMPWGTPVGINQVVWDTFTNTLHVESDALLAQHTRFALIVTRGVRDEGGTPIEASDAFRRFRAEVREDYRQELLDAIQAARHVGIREEDIAVASVFTTQSVTAILEKIHDQIHEATPDPADFLLGPNGERTVFSLDQVTGIDWSKQVLVTPPEPPAPAPLDLSLLQVFPGTVGSLAFGRYTSPDYEVHRGEYIPPVGTRSGTPAVQEINDIYFNLFLPYGPEPANGWPVAIFVHGNNGNKNETPLKVVNSMAKYGIATIAINNVGHGLGSQGTLTVRRTVGNQIEFPAGGRGIDQNNDGQIGANEGIATARPRSLVFFSDGYRQTAVDLMQLAQVIEVGMDVDGDGHPDLDPSRIYYFSQSVGSGIGTVFLSVEPNVRVGVLTVPFDPIPGGRLSCVNRFAAGANLASRQPSLLNSSTGIKVLDGCAVNPPLFNENMPLRDGIPLTVQLKNGTTTIIQAPVINTVAGAMAIQSGIENLEWIGQAGSPAAYAPHLRKAPLDGVSAKSVIFLTAEGDQTAPNPTTTAILRAGELADRTLYYRHDLYRSLFPGLPANPHGFAVDLDRFGLISLGVQDMVGRFFFSDGVLFTVPEPSQFFEFPIMPPLPEGLNYTP